MKADLDNQKNIKSQLENLLDDLDEKSTSLLDKDALSKIPSEFMDFDREKDNADKEAKEIIESIISFYIKDSIYSHEKASRFLTSKKTRDIMTMSDIIFQMRTAEHAIKRLLQDIDNGNLHARNFEVLAALQKSKMEIIKHLSFVQIQFENNYKLLRQEHEHLSEVSLDDEELEERGGFGSKGLIKGLKEKNS